MYDVAVVGAGLAGLQSARLLAGWGLDVVIIDRKADVAERVHTTGIFVRRTLEDYDLPDDCLGPSIREVVLVSPGGRALALSSDEDEFRVGRMGDLYRRWLGEAVDAGATWMPRTDFLSLTPRGEASALHLRQGTDPIELEARFVIGADGATSHVAPALGLPTNDEFLVGVEDVLEGVPLDGPPRFEVHLDPVISPGYLAWVVHDGEEVHVGVGGYADRFRPSEALAELRARVGGRWRLDRGRKVEHRGGRIPVGGVLPRIATARGLVTGDAAGAVSPLTAGGLDPCLRLSALGAHVAYRYLDDGDPAVLDRYDGGTFRARFRSRLALRRLLSLVREPWMAEAGCWALRTGPGRRLADEVFFGHGSFPIERPPTTPTAPLSPPAAASSRRQGTWRGR